MWSQVWVPRTNVSTGHSSMCLLVSAVGRQTSRFLGFLPSQPTLIRQAQVPVRGRLKKDEQCLKDSQTKFDLWLPSTHMCICTHTYTKIHIHMYTHIRKLDIYNHMPPSFALWLNWITKHSASHQQTLQKTSDCSWVLTASVVHSDLG